MTDAEPDEAPETADGGPVEARGYIRTRRPSLGRLSLRAVVVLVLYFAALVIAGLAVQHGYTPPFLRIK